MQLGLMEAAKSHTGNNLSIEEREWFSEMIHSIKQDELLLDIGVASDDTKELYSDLFNGNILGISKKLKNEFDQIIIKDVVVDFVRELIHRDQKEVKLAFNVSGSKLLVWAEIEDDDDKAETDLFLSEAKINAKYLDFNYSISTTVVEVSDYLTAPPHYIDFE